MSNAQFSDYVTSGAFSLTLTRNQVSALSLLEGGMEPYLGNLMAALERKGLAEKVANPTEHDPDHTETRATLAGLLTLALCREAGLTNGPADPLAAELAGLRAEVERRRIEARTARANARSLAARLEKAEEDLFNSEARQTGGKFRVRIRLRDQQPDLPTADLIQAVQEPA